MSIAEQIPRLVAGLERVGWMNAHPPADPIGEEEIRRIAADVSMMDPGWIDPDILAWWSWHNGFVDQTPNDRSAYVSPDFYLSVAPFEMVCRDFFDERSEVALDPAVDTPELLELMIEHPTVPLDEHDGSHVCVRRMSESAEWVLCQFVKEWEWQGLATGDGSTGQMVPFADYLCVLCDRLEEGAFTLSRYGDLVNAETMESDLLYYPWR